MAEATEDTSLARADPELILQKLQELETIIRSTYSKEFAHGKELIVNTNIV